VRASGWIRQHWLATLALFVALGGTGYAASAARNSVKSSSVKNGAIKSVDVHNDSLTGADVLESSLKLPAGPTGPQGARGVTGVQGPLGLTGAAGTAGQQASTVFGTGQLQVTAATNYTLIPGLTTAVTVPADADVYVATDGGVQNTGVGNTFAMVEVALFLDGSISPSAGQRRVTAANTTGLAQVVANWSFGRVYSVSPGPHTFEVRAAAGDPGTATANVSSASAPQLQGTLTVAVIKH
jgi:hypothetical protein